MPPRTSGTASASRGRGRGAVNKSTSTGRGAAATAGSGTSRATSRGRGTGTPRGRKRPQQQQQQDEEEDDAGEQQPRVVDLADGDDGDRTMERGGEMDGGSMDVSDGEEDEDDEGSEKIPPELLTRILHAFFEREGTRMTRDANAAVARYMDIFVREAIARAAVERTGGFLEVEDLEKIAPQLLMDL
ncbi:CENP-S associating centromere protein X-domain-containing protein [Chaetomium sp. MPI-CAGE-AT-0009]|nr:CENP-S associating centromere protein X-domain-containing protein [Chaetomium sp. MPI-CAGE-AT-0009]